MQRERLSSIAKTILTAALALMWSAPSFAVLEEPLERRVLTPVDPHQFPSGLCPGSVAPKPAIQSKTAEKPAKPTALGLVETLRRHEAAMYAANAVYELPDLENSMTGHSLVRGFERFFKSVPKGYDLFAYMAEPEAGMKYTIYEPEVPTRPWIFAVAGTQSILDWAANIDLGHAQLEKLERVTDLFTTCQYLDRRGEPLAIHDLIITGHSLGGGLAQAIAYRIQKIRLAKRLSPMRIDLVTFNAFGSQNLIEKDESYVARIAASLKAANYFVTGDPVSVIGQHVGPTYEIKYQGALPAIMEPLTRHSMTTIIALARERGAAGLFLVAPRNKPDKPFALDQLVILGGIFSGLPREVARLSEFNVVRLLNEAADDLAMTRMTCSESTTRTIAYVSRLVTARISALENREPSFETATSLGLLEHAGRTMRAVQAAAVQSCLSLR